MPEKDRIKYEKIKFIDKNKEVLRECILEKVLYKDKYDTVALILLSLLVSNDPVIINEAYNSLLSLSIDTKKTEYDGAELEEIIGMVKCFISKAYSGTKKELELINVVDEHYMILDHYSTLDSKTYKKALNY